MTRFTAPSSAALALLLVSAPALYAQAPTQAPDEDDYQGESPERYAQVRALEGDVRIVKGDHEEALTRGIPVAEGDVVESRGRGVLQLGDGTRIAFAGSTRFHIAALFTDRSGQRQVLLRVDHGRVRIQAGQNSEARIRVDTASGTATLRDGSNASIEVDRERTVQVRVHRGRVRFANEADRTTLTAGDRLTVYGNRDQLDRVRSFNTYDIDPFDEWCVDQFRHRRRAGNRYLPAEIDPYGDDLDEHGEWIYVDDTSSWCWRPRVSVEWRPYWQGRWGAYAGGMTWIADEPWGYVTHHHGRWGWHQRHGWYWIPGVFYAPAWVAWNTFDALFGWAPLGYWNAPCTWGYGAWGGGHCWNVVNVSFVGHHGLHRHIHSDITVIRNFSRGTGATSWSVAGGSGRSVTAPWQRGPLMVNRNELGNPGEFRRVVSQRPVMLERERTYERQAQAATGRSIVRRDAASRPQPVEGPGGVRQSVPTPFEDRTRPATARPLVRESRPVPPADGPRTQDRVDRPREGAVERDTPPRERVHEDRPRPGTTERETPPRERVREDRPREGASERDVPPRERVREERPRDTERPTPLRERLQVERPAPPREVERPAPPREERPAPPREVERPAPPRHDPPRESRPYTPPPPPPAAPPSRPAERPSGRR